MTLHPYTNPTHARAAGWLNLWPALAAQPPLPAAHLWPLERAFLLAGEEVRPAMDWEEEARMWERGLN